MTVRRPLIQALGLSVAVFLALLVLSHASLGVYYPTGEPVQRSFEPMLTGVLSIAAGILTAILLAYLPGQANHE